MGGGRSVPKRYLKGTNDATKDVSERYVQRCVLICDQSRQRRKSKRMRGGGGKAEENAFKEVN